VLEDLADNREGELSAFVVGDIALEGGVLLEGFWHQCGVLL
jgi:hypothetical protein